MIEHDLNRLKEVFGDWSFKEPRPHPRAAYYGGQFVGTWPPAEEWNVWLETCTGRSA